MAFSKRYIELATPSVSSRGRVVPLDELPKYLSNKTEVYRSMFILDDSAEEHFSQRKTIKSFKGEYMLDRILFDIDKHILTGRELLDKVKEFIDNELRESFELNSIRIWFSGRGFHVEIPDYFGFKPSNNLPQIVKKTIKKKFGNLVDNIYDGGRLIRIGYSYNNKSNCYKIPIKYEELSLPYSKIMEMAQAQFRDDFQFAKWNDETTHIWKDDIVAVSETERPVSVQIEGVKLGTHVTCVQKMWNKGEVKGSRHSTLLRIVNAWKRSGIPVEVATTGAKTYAKSLNDEEVGRIVDSVYKWEHDGYSCHDIVMAEYCDSMCRYYRAKNFGNSITTIGSVSERYQKFISEDFSSKGLNLKDYYSDITSDYQFIPEEMIIVIGDTKLGKTAWVQNLCVEANHLNTLYMTLEVGELQIYRRFCQIAHDMSKFEVIQYHTECDSTMLNEFRKPINHIKFLQVSPELSDVKALINESGAQLIVIDTIDGIQVMYNNDPINKMDKIASQLKQIAQQLGVIIIGISHISRSASREYLDIHSAKGNSAIEQKADKIIGITGDREDTSHRIIRALGSRDENNFHISCNFDYNTFKFREFK